ncbi:MAG: putative ATPase/DNA-binding SARP family transcriptional activator [Candidatus Promineifilaceae bacterium]|jgi:predicted ATPase/DNA-binding SARP family transcriptional activator
MQTTLATTLKISLLGPLQLYHSVTGEIKENRRKVQALLIWLLLEDNQAHSREQLIALLWPEMSRDDGLNNLRVTLSRVKKHLADGDALEASRSGVTLLRSPSHNIDVRHFEAFIKETEKHNHESLASCTSCQEKLHAATKLFRGRFLDGFSLDDSEAFEEWLFVWRERYHVMGLRQLGRLAEAEIANGRLAEAEALAQRQIKIDPLQESAHRLLMRIAAERGDRTQALRQFKICTDMLEAELGVTPEEETILLKQQIELGEYRLRSQPKPFVAEKSDSNSSTVGHLPEITTPFIGREEELYLLAGRLASPQYRLISLVGPGGIGKTRLAIQAAKMAQGDFKDGVFFVPLVGLSSHHDIPAAVAEATGFSLTSDSIKPEEQLAKILAQRETLLVIDNLEHIIEGADILLTWLEKAPNLVLLVTSRQRINAQVEDLFRLKGLPWPKEPHDPDATSYEAVRLFGDRAHRLNKQFWLNEDTIPSVVSICQQVEGLPLALELAATSIRDFDVTEIAESLQQEPELLATDQRDMPARHRQIEAVFDYSWRLLTQPEQKVLAQLSLFAGGFTLKAARAVTGSSATILTHLRYKSLIRSEGNGRFSMHELLRQLAAKRLRQTLDLAQKTEKAHADIFVQLVVEKSLLLSTSKAAETANWLKRDLDNIRAAWHSIINRFDLAQLERIAPPSVEFYTHIGLDFEIEGLIDEAVKTFKDHPKAIPQNLDLLLKLLTLDLKSSHLVAQRFEPLFDEFIELLASWGNEKHLLFQSKAYRFLCEVLGKGENKYSPGESAEMALKLAYQANDPKNLGEALVNRAIQYYRHSQIDEAIEQLNKAVSIFESIGDLKGLAKAVYTLAAAYSENGSFWKGLEYDRRAVELYKQLGYEEKIAVAHMGITLSYNLLGDFDRARWHGNQSLNRYRKIGHETGVYYAISALGEAAMMEGSVDEAIELYFQCVDYRRKTEDYTRLRDEGIDASRSLWMAGRSEEGLELALEVIDILMKFEIQEDLYAAQILLANIYWDMGKHKAGLELALSVFAHADLKKMGNPIQTCYELYRLFDIAEHGDKRSVLKIAHDIISQTAAEVTDANLLQSFLYNVVYCRKLLEAFDKHNLSKIRPDAVLA